MEMRLEKKKVWEIEGSKKKKKNKSIKQIFANLPSATGTRENRETGREEIVIESNEKK